MSKQPPNDPFEADLQTIENAMNSMMQGAFSMLFKQLVDTTFEDPTTTTILDGKNLKTADSIVEDDFGGNDFKRLRNKSKQNRGLITSSDEAENNQLQTKNNNSSAGPILNLLFQNDQQDQQPRDDKVTSYNSPGHNNSC